MLHVKAFTFNPVEENSYILYNDEKQCCIIDPGCYFPDEEDELRNFIEKSGLQPLRLLNTHCHFDHVFGNKFVSRAWNLTPEIHPLEEKMLQLAAVSAQKWQLPFANYEGELIFLREGDKVVVGADELTVLFAPGHSPGSICFYNEENGFVIGGDVLFSGSIGRTDLPGGDYKTLISSIQTQFFTLPDDTKVYPGHGPVTTIGFEKMNNPFVKLY